MALHLQQLIKKQRLKPDLSPSSERTASYPLARQDLGLDSGIIHCLQQTASMGEELKAFSQQ